MVREGGLLNAVEPQRQRTKSFRWMGGPLPGLTFLHQLFGTILLLFCLSELLNLQLPKQIAAIVGPSSCCLWVKIRDLRPSLQPVLVRKRKRHIPFYLQYCLINSPSIVHATLEVILGLITKLIPQKYSEAIACPTRNTSKSNQSHNYLK